MGDAGDSDVDGDNDDTNRTGYDSLENRILDGHYRITDKALYGGMMYGAFVLPSNFFRIIVTTLFPPIGEIFNIMDKHIVGGFPWITWKGLVELLQNVERVIYCFALTSMFYIPGLIYALGGIRNGRQKNTVIKIQKWNN
jgi:uncharacterized membrane protein YqaE (UPF0057 family)